MHVAIIMDGNGRWAARRHLPRMLYGFASGACETDASLRDNREAFAEFLKANASRIDAFFAGHFHSGLRGWDDTFGIHEVVVPSACWNFNGKRLRGAPGYTFTEDRPGWVLAEVRGPGEIKLSYKPIGADVSVVKELARA